MYILFSKSVSGSSTFLPISFLVPPKTYAPRGPSSGPSTSSFGINILLTGILSWTDFIMGSGSFGKNIILATLLTTMTLHLACQAIWLIKSTIGLFDSKAKLEG